MTLGEMARPSGFAARRDIVGEHLTLAIRLCDRHQRYFEWAAWRLTAILPGSTQAIAATNAGATGRRAAAVEVIAAARRVGYGPESREATVDPGGRRGGPPEAYRICWSAALATGSSSRVKPQSLLSSASRNPTAWSLALPAKVSEAWT